jgi:glycosyltransferase involved in cell wall biosynthesis
MKALKISVIVPIYNSEKYLIKCLESIVNQSYKNLEIILVNDGSTDSSRTIIEAYTAKDNRIVAIHKENGGIGSAYRVALGKVSGDFISFVDSDDFIDLNMYEELSKIIIEKNPDIIHFGYVFINNKNEIIYKNKTFDEFIKGNDNIFTKHFTSIKDPSLACRLFRKSLFSQVKLLDQNVGIDEIVYPQTLSNCNSVVHISKTYYYAFARNDSVSRNTYSRGKIMEGIIVQRYICNYFQDHFKKYLPYVYSKYLNYLLFTYDISKADKEIQRSMEFNSIIQDIRLYYYKAIKTNDFSHISYQLNAKLKAFVIYPSLYPSVARLFRFNYVIKNCYRQLFQKRMCNFSHKPINQ